jgi:hypothetical protein
VIPEFLHPATQNERFFLEERRSFLKKRTKKLSLPFGRVWHRQRHIKKIKVFLLLFVHKKKFFFYFLNLTSPDLTYLNHAIGSDAAKLQYSIAAVTPSVKYHEGTIDCARLGD